MQQKFDKKVNEQLTVVRKTRINFVTKNIIRVLIQMKTVQKNNIITKKQVQELLENNQEKFCKNKFP